jgi:acetyl-CoA carboxylase beta subunit
MRNPLDDIYGDYKSRKSFRQPEKEMTSNEIPTPYIDNEVSMTGGFRGCPKCGSMNISVDMSSNKTICNDCKDGQDKPHRVNFTKEMEDAQEQETFNMIMAQRRGVRFER